MDISLYQGNILDVLKEIPDETVDCIVTSPPYYGMRNYSAEAEADWGDWSGQLGQEPHYTEYIDHLLSATLEMQRVLKRTGTLFLNIDDSSNNDVGTGGSLGNEKSLCKMGRFNKYSNTIPRKSLMLIPERLQIGMVDRQGWILRQIISWNKLNGTPKGYYDNFANKFERIFFFTKSNTDQFWTNQESGETVYRKPAGIKGKEGTDWHWRIMPVGPDEKQRRGWETFEENGRLFKRKKQTNWRSYDYYFDLDSIRVPFAESTIKRLKQKNILGQLRSEGVTSKADHTQTKDIKRILTGMAQKFENEGSFRKKHSGVKNADGSTRLNAKGANPGNIITTAVGGNKHMHFAIYPEKLIIPLIKAGCPKEGTVLDPFAGSGTTLKVARDLGRSAMGIEINPEYIEIIKQRVGWRSALGINFREYKLEDTLKVIA